MKPAPLVLLSALTMTSLPAARKVRHVEAARHQGKDLVVLGLTLEGETAVDFDLSGAIPTPSGMGGIHFAGMPGGMNPAPAETTIDLALYLDPEGGDVHRVHFKTYKENALPGHVQIAFAGPGGAGPGQAGEGEDEGQQGGRQGYEGGLPARKPKDAESMQYYRISFSNHPLAEMPKWRRGTGSCWAFADIGASPRIGDIGGWR